MNFATGRDRHRTGLITALLLAVASGAVVAQRGGTAPLTLIVADQVGKESSTSSTIAVLPPFSFATGLGSPSVGQGALVWGDADRDGDLDLLVSGGRYDNFGFRTSILRNDRTGTFTATLAELNPVSQGDAAWGDVDRDGDLDALVTGYTESQNPSTTLYRNNSPSSFAAMSLGLTRLPNLGNSAVALADADGDGDLDVLLAGNGIGTAREAGIYLNDGSGSFSNSLFVLPLVSLGAVAWADYDGDGDADFVLTGSTNGVASGAVSRLYRNLGGRTFEEASVGLPAVFRSAVGWADYDRDGDPDLFIAGESRTGPVARLLRNDAGTFTSVANLPGLVDGAVAWGDANLDGYPDLAVSGRTTTGAGPLFSRVYWNQAGTLVDSGTPLPGLHLSALAWGDLDHDGLLDLAVAGSTNEGLTLYNGQTYSAVFHNNLAVSAPPLPPVPTGLAASVQGSLVTLSWSPTVPEAGGLSYDLRVGRLPGDGNVVNPFADPTTGVRRVAQAGQAGWSSRRVLRNLPAGTYYWSAQSVDAAHRGSPFAAEQQFVVSNVLPTISSMANQVMAMNSTAGPFELIVDDPDGDDSLLAVSAVSSIPRLFPEGSVQITGSGSTRSVMLSPALNEAGTATIIFTVRDPAGGFATSSARITVQALIDVQGGFTDGQFSILEPADVDNDGDLDVLLAGTESTGGSSGRSSVRLFLNSGNAVFTPTDPVTLPPVFDGAFAAWGDYDADGDLDLFYNGSIYRNNGGTLTSVSVLLAGISNGQAAWGDYDSDGDLDLAVTGALGGSYISRIYRLDGNGVFTSINAPLQGLHYSSVAWGDPDADGDLDLVIAGAAAENTSLSANGRMYRNDGGIFVEVLSFLGVVNGKLAWGDVNGDGRVDLVVAGSHGSSTINDLQLNLGGWRFSNLPLQPGGALWTDTRLLDWDSDGDLDLLGGVNSVVAVYLNPGTGEFPTSSAASIGIRCRALRFGDFDNDADFDVLLSNAGTSGFTGQTRIYRNRRVVTQPAPPLTPVTTVEGNAVLLRWPAVPPIDGAPVTYNVRVGTTPGSGDVLSPLARSDGRRLVPLNGNVGFANTLRLRLLPAGNYHWAVQPVDIGWHGGAWTPGGSFTIAPWPAVHIVSLERIVPGQWRIRFSAPAGRLVAIETGNDLRTWTESSRVTVGVAGTSQVDAFVSGDYNFFRLNLPQ